MVGTRSRSHPRRGVRRRQVLQSKPCSGRQTRKRTKPHVGRNENYSEKTWGPRRVTAADIESLFLPLSLPPIRAILFSSDGPRSYPRHKKANKTTKKSWQARTLQPPAGRVATPYQKEGRARSSVTLPFLRVFRVRASADLVPGNSRASFQERARPWVIPRHPERPIGMQAILQHRADGTSRCSRPGRSSSEPGPAGRNLSPLRSVRPCSRHPRWC